MKYLFLLIPILFTLQTFADKFELVGQVNMISTRNIESSLNYQLLKTGSNDSKKALKDLRGRSIDEAINNAVLDVPGGEFLKNVKIYFDGKFFSVVGDVWGITENANIEGFRIGDIVFLKNSLLKDVTGGDKFEKVTITGFKDRKTCLVTLENGQIKEADYSDLSKSESVN